MKKARPLTSPRRPPSFVAGNNELVGWHFPASLSLNRFSKMDRRAALALHDARDGAGGATNTPRELGSLIAGLNKILFKELHDAMFCQIRK